MAEIVTDLSVVTTVPPATSATVSTRIVLRLIAPAPTMPIVNLKPLLYWPAPAIDQASIFWVAFAVTTRSPPVSVTFAPSTRASTRPRPSASVPMSLRATDTPAASARLLPSAKATAPAIALIAAESSAVTFSPVATIVVPWPTTADVERAATLIAADPAPTTVRPMLPGLVNLS